ncbi:MAG: ABC transporter permease [Candidatus Sumerlaeaceae bacterium]|nr:ABC transporter permease [Candidatus Sumerlaeaceae bacterium]
MSATPSIYSSPHVPRCGIGFMMMRSMRQHALSSIIAIVCVALATGLTISVVSINAQAYKVFTGGQAGFDAVLGARGSQLQLVLNAVFHLETSPGNIPWSLYQAVKKDPRVELAVPYALGDNYNGFRIVGTTEELFTKFEFEKGRKFAIAPGGRMFDTTRREAVIGSFVSRQTGLKVGSNFNPFHGLNFDPKAKHDEVYVVTGVMEPSNTPSDRVIWIPIEGVYRMEGHVLRGADKEFKPAAGEEIPDEHKEVSAVMLKLRSPQGGFSLEQMINKQGKVATLAFPIGRTMADLFDKMGWVNRILGLVAYLVAVVAAGTILASIYNTINERRREFAILRALGARRRRVFTAIVAEASTIAAIGAAAGLLVYLGILGVAAKIVQAQTGVVLDLMFPHQILYLAPLGMIALGALAGIVPAIKAYGTDVAENISPTS